MNGGWVFAGRPGESNHPEFSSLASGSLHRGPWKGNRGQRERDLIAGVREKACNGFVSEPGREAVWAAMSVQRLQVWAPGLPVSTASCSHASTGL